MPKTPLSRKPKRAITSALEESTQPPSDLKPGQTIAKLCKAEGNHLYSIILPRSFTNTLAPVSASKSGSGSKVQDKDSSDKTVIESASQVGNPTADEKSGSESCLVELTSVLRGALFLRRNGYVLVDTDRELLGGRENKIVGIIVGVVLGGKEEKEWRAMKYWPAEFGKQKAWDDDDEEEEEGSQIASDEDDW